MILITGGLGFIGQHVAKSLLDVGESCVLGQRRPAAGPPDWLVASVEGADKRVVVEQVDVADRAALLDLGARHEITGIVHLAGAAHGSKGPLGNARDEIAGLLNVFEAAEAWGASRVGIASTIGVYGGIDASVMREEMPLLLETPHPIPAFKKVDEVLAGYIGAATGVEAVCYRIAAIWGPLGRPASPYVVAGQFVHAAVRGVKPDLSNLYAPPYAGDGSDFCYVKDCGRAIALLQTAEKLNHRVYNVSSGRVTTNQQLIEAIRAVIPGAGVELPEGRNPQYPGPNLYLDITRARADVGYEPEYDVERAVADYVAWLRAGNEK
jgi:UDP-glucose 4-epimerase